MLIIYKRAMIYVFFVLVAAFAVQVHAADSQRLFNPNIGVILNGKYASKEPKGFSIDESELNFNANIDHNLMGNLTIGFADENAEVEEAFIRTIALPYGLSLTAGRIMPTFGYLNEKHKHTDDFLFRPHVLREYFEEGFFNADGVQGSIILPINLYSEIGGGVFNKNDFTAYTRIGGGDILAWRLGASYYHKKDDESAQDFAGVDFKASYSPNGNSRETEFAIYGEHITQRTQNSGFYVATTYKWKQQWRTGYMYSALDKIAEHAVMIEYDTSEFGRIRLQYGFGEVKQIVLQYTISMGAHVAHSF